MKKLTPYLYFILVIFVTLGLFSFSLGRNNNRVISDIKVEFKGGENYFLSHELVRRDLVQNGTSVINQSRKSIDLFQLENLLSNAPYVEESDISISPKGVLKALIKQRIPIARILGPNENYYIDKFLVKMPISLNFSARVPFVNGVSTEKDIVDLERLMSYVRNDDFLNKEIVAVKKKKNGFNLLVRSGDYIINFGDIVNVEKKFRNLKAFYSKALLDRTINLYKEVNIKYSNQVVCVKKG